VDNLTFQSDVRRGVEDNDAGLTLKLLDDVPQETKTLTLLEKRSKAILPEQNPRFFLSPRAALLGLVCLSRLT
jgi:hypothetical protein